SPHHLVPDALLQRPVALKQFVAPQALFAIIAAAQSCPLDRHIEKADSITFVLDKVRRSWFGTRNLWTEPLG
ncbi:MAG: hypothetical protein JWO48_3702, partial [Bryobacterales bacterium]|nr:hypothetical protein [Bryobacterales bacterium]